MNFAQGGISTYIKVVYLAFWGNIYAPTNVCVKVIDSKASMVLQNYQNFTEMTSNMIHIVAFGVSLKSQRKIHLNTQWGRGERTCLSVVMTWRG